MSWKNVSFSLAVAIGLLADQGTKAWARSAVALQSQDGWAIHSKLLHFVHRENDAAAFSMLSSLPESWRVGVLGIFNLIGVALGVWLFVQTPPQRPFRALALGAFVAGALGNGIDRFAAGSVTDFIRVHFDIEPVYSLLLTVFSRADGPVFNIADVLLIAGVIGVVVMDLRWDRRRPIPEGPNAAP